MTRGRPSSWDFDFMKVDIRYVGKPEETVFAYDLLMSLIVDSYKTEGLLKYFEDRNVYNPIEFSIYQGWPVYGRRPIKNGDRLIYSSKFGVGNSCPDIRFLISLNSSQDLRNEDFN